MRTHESQSAGGRGRFSRLSIGALWVFALSMIIVPLQAQQSHAAELDAITGVTIVDPVNEVRVGDSMRIEAKWSVQNAQVGDTFKLALPTSPRFDGTALSFPLTEPGGAQIGTCAVTTIDISCVFNDYVTTHPDVAGTLYFFASAAEESSQGDVQFKTAGRTIVVPVPGGKIGPALGQNWFTNPLKDGAINHANWSVDYSVYVPGHVMLEQPGPIVITDKYDTRLGPLARNPRIYYVSEAQWTGPNPWGYNQFVDASLFTWTDDGAGNLGVTIAPAAIDPNILYIVQYRLALPWNAADGEVYINSASGSGWQVSTQTEYLQAGGGGTGSSLRNVSLTKAVDGDSPSSGPFTFELSCLNAAQAPVSGYPQTQSLRAGETIGFTRIPIDSTCTFTETDNGGADSVSYSQNPIVITDQSPATVAVTATNTFVNPVPGTGSIALSKLVEGSAAAEVPEDLQFTVKYSYNDAAGGPVTGTLTLVKGARVALDNIPDGTVVTLSELDLPAGFDWKTPVFTVNGDPSNGSAQVTVVAGTVVEVQLTNTAEPVGTEVPEKPTEKPTEKPSENELAKTGFSGRDLAVFSSLLVTMGLGAFAMRRIRHS